MRLGGTTVILGLLASLIWIVNSKMDWDDKMKDTVMALAVAAMIWTIYIWGTYPGTGECPAP